MVPDIEVIEYYIYSHVYPFPEVHERRNNGQEMKECILIVTQDMIIYVDGALVAE